jgi:hypothetical protein
LNNLFKAKRWEEYRDFFQLWFIRYFIGWFSLVPLLHRILRGLPNKIEISNDWTGIVPGVVFNPSKPLVLNLTLPFTWQLLWIASFLFFVAFIIYQVKCPAFVKKYNRYADYLSYGHDARHLAWEVSDLFRHPGVDKEKFVSRCLVKKFVLDAKEKFDSDEVQVKENASSFYFKHNDVPYEFSAPVCCDVSNGLTGDHIEAERGVFWEVFGCYSALGNPWRKSIQVLLVFCWAIVIVILVEYVWSGLSLCVTWFRGISDSLLMAFQSGLDLLPIWIHRLLGVFG